MNCGWQEVRQVRVESIDTTAGDEAAVERLDPYLTHFLPPAVHRSFVFS